MQQRVSKNTAPKEENQLSQIMAGYISYWPLFLICLALALGAAYFYIRYTVPKYEADASILVNDAKRGVGESKTVEAIDPINTSKIIENEVEVLQSQSLLDSVTVKLRMYAPIKQQGKLRIQSAYFTCPIAVEAKDPYRLQYAEKIPIKFDSAHNRAVLDNSIAYPLNTWVKTAYGELKFIENPNYRSYYASTNQFFLTLMRVRDASGFLQIPLKIESSKTSSVIDLSYRDEIPEKAEDILNALIYYYNKSAIAEKNNLVKNTLASIESRLQVVSSSLDSIEKKIKDFRTSHRAVNLSTQGQEYLNLVGSSDIKAKEVQTQVKQLNDMKDYVNSNETIGVLPLASGVNDNALTQQMTTLNNAQMEYERLKKTVGEGNPLLVSLKEQIAKMKPNILSSIETQIKNLQLSQNSYSSTSGQYNSMLSAIPEQERQLLEISRDQNIQNGIYQFLLQKREESVLSYTNVNPDTKVVNYAKAGPNPVSPKTNIIYLGALVLGLLPARTPRPWSGPSSASAATGSPGTTGRSAR